MSLLTMIMNPHNLDDIMNMLDRWDALIRDCEMKFDKDDISDKMRQAALFAMASEAVVENRLAGRRDLDNYAESPHQGQKKEKRPAEAPRNDVGLRGRIERRKE